MVPNTRVQAAYSALGINGDHHWVFEDMFPALPQIE
jgi:hypothetical protein